MYNRRMAKKRELPPLPVKPNPAQALCPLCSRPLGEAHVDEHHLVPKSEGGRAKFPIHRVCHTKIHSLFTEPELASAYFTWEALKSHPEMESFIRWVARKPSHYIARNRRAARKGPR